MTGERVGGVELGGTKCVAAVGRPGRIEDRIELPTGVPGPTLAALADWLRAREPSAIGIASFGPVALDPRRPDRGRILAETKRGWGGADVFAPFAASGVPVALDTDVGAAGLAEARLGAARDASLALYVTLGTGIGGAWTRDGVVLRGALHSELGHLSVPRAPGDDFPGVCAIHGGCVEGLASGPALAARAAGRADLAPDDPAWTPVVHAIGELLAACLRVLPAEAVVLGGGMATGNPWLVARLADATASALDGYPPGLDAHAILRPAALGRDAGVTGALLLAADG